MIISRPRHPLRPGTSDGRGNESKQGGFVEPSLMQAAVAST
jgi:hypothetical protein